MTHVVWRWLRAVVGLTVAIVGGLWTLSAIPGICPYPCCCGPHVEMWDATIWVAVLGGLAAIFLGLGLLFREIVIQLRSTPSVGR
jgi:hypothetical protein